MAFFQAWLDQYEAWQTSETAKEVYKTQSEYEQKRIDKLTDDSSMSKRGRWGSSRAVIAGDSNVITGSTLIMSICGNRKMASVGRYPQNGVAFVR